MKKSRILITGAMAVLVAGALALAGCGASGTKISSDSGSGSESSSSEVKTVQKGKLLAVSDLSFPPMGSIPEGGKAADATGFEIDMLKEIGKRLDLETEYIEPVKFDTIVPLIKQGGKADIGLAGITITDERLQEVDFTDPYLDSNQGVVVKADSASTDATAVDDLNKPEKKIAVQSGTTGESWVKENLPQAQLVALDDTVQMMTGCQSGLYDAVVTDLPVVSYMVKNSYHDLKVVKQVPTGEQYGMAVSKDDPGLKDAINKALKEMQDDGTMKSLKEKWFGADI